MVRVKVIEIPVMDKLRFILGIKKIDFLFNLTLSRAEGIRKLKLLLDEEIGNSDSDYRIIGSFRNMNEKEFITLIIEKQSGNRRFDVIASSFEILEGSTLRLDGNVVNKCKSYGELGILMFLIGLLSYSVISVTGNEMLLRIFIFSTVVIWFAVDIYRRPFKALNFMKQSLSRLDEKM